MDKVKILDYLKNQGVSQEIEEIDYKKDFLVLRFFYGYDGDELEAAKEYANSQTDSEDEDKWYDEYYIPYLIDIAVDEVRDTMEEIVEELDVNAEYITYQPDREDESCEFIAVFSASGNEFEIDDVLEALGI
jgi:ribosomal 30S subunit maturation factor RimM